MIECMNGEIRDMLPGLVHDRLDESDRARVESHLSACAACASEAELIRQAAAVIALGVPRVDRTRVVSAIEAAGVPAAVPQRRASWQRRPLQLAAAALLAVAVVGGLELANRERAPETSAVSAASVPAGARVEPVSPRAGLALVGGIEALTADELAVLVAGVETLSPDFEMDADMLFLAEEVL